MDVSDDACGGRRFRRDIRIVEQIRLSFDTIILQPSDMFGRLLYIFNCFAAVDKKICESLADILRDPMLFDVFDIKIQGIR